MKSVWSKFKPASNQSLEEAGLGYLFGAWLASSDLVTEMLNAPDDVADKMTEQWQSLKQQQIQFVAVTSALVSTTIAATFAWKNVENGPASTLACWYSGLLIAIVSITSGVQQSTILRKLSCYPDGLVRIRKLLRSSKQNRNGKFRENTLQHFLWQTPIMLLNFSIVLFVIGLLIMVFTAPLFNDALNDSQKNTVRITFIREMNFRFAERRR
ncbi:hypothetical protein V8E51_011297 [Hyaloscypha variabilis]